MHGFATLANSLASVPNEQGERQRRSFHISNALFSNLERISTYFRLAPSHGNGTAHGAAITAVADGSIFTAINGMHNSATAWLQHNLALCTGRLVAAEQEVGRLTSECATHRDNVKQAATDNEGLLQQLREVGEGGCM
jgi:hypothetical protein